MNNVDSLIDHFPPETRDLFRTVWDMLSQSEKNSLLQMLSGLPTNNNLLKSLIRLSSKELKLAFGSKRKVAIVGPANVGKSTLYNQLIQDQKDSARVSPLPGTTRTVQSADSGLFSVVDTPGADAVGEVGERERDEAFHAAKSADFLIIIFDAIQGIKQTELDLFDHLKTLGKPYLVVLNKTDLVRKEAPQIIAKAAQNLNLAPEQIIGISAKAGENLDRIISGIAALEPEIVAALGSAMPAFRWMLSWRTIVSAASVSAAIALAPLPGIDFVPLIITQSVMVLGIARIYNFRLTLARAKELVVTFGLGFLGRTLFQELSKLGGIPGWVLSAAIASSTTVVMGYAAVIWFERSQKLTPGTLKKLTTTMTQYMLEALRGFAKRKPSKESLKERIEKALTESPYAESRESFDSQAEVRLE